MGLFKRRTPIVDKNGKLTTVWKKDALETSENARQLPSTPPPPVVDSAQDWQKRKEEALKRHERLRNRRDAFIEDLEVIPVPEELDELWLAAYMKSGGKVTLDDRPSSKKFQTPTRDGNSTVPENYGADSIGLLVVREVSPNIMREASNSNSSRLFGHNKIRTLELDGDNLIATSNEWGVRATREQIKTATQLNVASAAKEYYSSVGVETIANIQSPKGVTDPKSRRDYMAGNS